MNFQLANEIGVKPNLARLALTDPPVALRLLLGPSLPYQYRLSGPNAWPGARDAILGYEERVRQALRTSSTLEHRKTLLKPDLDTLLMATLALFLLSWLLATGWFFPSSWSLPQVA